MYTVEFYEKTNGESDVWNFLEEDIWDLRPGCNRVFYFYYKDKTFVLLHHFRKRSQRTPKRELLRAKAEQNDYLAQKEAS